MQAELNAIHSSCDDLIMLSFLKNKYSLLQKREKVKNIVSNSGWLIFDKIIRMGVGLLVGVWVARYLGPEQFGELNYAIAFVSMFSVLATFGLDSIAVRELVDQSDKYQAILGSAIWIKFIGGIFSAVLTVITVLFFKSGETQTILVVSIIAFGTIFQVADVFDYFFQANVISKYTVWAKNSASVVGNSIRVVLILGNFELVYFALVISAEVLLGSVLSGFFFLRNRRSFRIIFDKYLAVKLLRDGMPLAFASIAITLYMRIDQIMIVEIMDQSSAGYYSAAVRITEIGYFLALVITSSLFPSIIQAKKRSEAEYFAILKGLYSLLFWVSFMIAISTSILSSVLIDILYGAEYKFSSQVLSIYAWSGIFVYLGIGTSQFLLAENLTKISLLRTIVGLIVNVALNFYLIPKYGVIGASVASLFSYASTIATLFFTGSTKSQGKLLISSLNPVSIKQLIGK